MPRRGDRGPVADDDAPSPAWHRGTHGTGHRPPVAIGAQHPSRVEQAAGRPRVAPGRGSRARRGGRAVSGEGVRGGLRERDRPGADPLPTAGAPDADRRRGTSARRAIPPRPALVRAVDRGHARAASPDRLGGRPRATMLHPHVPARDREPQHVARVARRTIGDGAGERPHLGHQQRHLGDDVLEFAEDAAVPRDSTSSTSHPSAMRPPVRSGTRTRSPASPGRAGARAPRSRRAGRAGGAVSRRAPWRRRRPPRQSPAAARRSSTRSSCSQVKSGSSRPKWP